MYHIYQITNIINKHRYIGFTSKRNPYDRWSVHKAYAKRFYSRGKSHLYCAMRKYCIENFSFEILAWGDDEKVGLKIVEPLFLEMFSPEYNMTKGGEGMLGYKHTEESKKKVSGENHYCFGTKLSEETRKAISLANTGKQYTEDRLAAHKKRMNDPDVKERLIISRRQQSYLYTCRCGKVGNVGNMKRWHVPKCVVAI